MASPLRNADLSKAQEQFLATLLTEFPEKRTHAGRLLAASLRGEDLRRRGLAATYFGGFRYRRGLRSLTEVLDRYDRTFRERGENPSGKARTSEWGYLSSVLYAVGCMDTPASHQLLRRVATTFSDPVVAASGLEMMVFEDECYEPPFLMGYLERSQSVPMILSALYALQYRLELFERIGDFNTRVTDLLEHEHPEVRVYALRVLAGGRMNEGILKAFLEDPEEPVREGAREALDLHNYYFGEGDGTQSYGTPD